MKVKTKKNCNGILIECPNGQGSFMFGEFLPFLVGGWNCIRCEFYNGVTNVSKDGNKAEVDCTKDQSLIQGERK